MVTAASDRAPGARAPRVWAALATVADPEIPVVSIVDLGMVRDVRDRDGRIEVDVSPTYSGCPATEVIEANVSSVLARLGYPDARVRRVLSPPWCTDFITAEGRRKLRDCGIAPPVHRVAASTIAAADVACPRCASVATTCISEFGSTPCKSSWRCDACREPFEHFKCL